MTIPTGEGHKCDLGAADGVGGPPEALRPIRAARNDAQYGGLNFDCTPKDDADDAVVAMQRDPYAKYPGHGSGDA